MRFQKEKEYRLTEVIDRMYTRKEHFTLETKNNRLAIYTTNS